MDRWMDLVLSSIHVPLNTKARLQNLTPITVVPTGQPAPQFVSKEIPL